MTETVLVTGGSGFLAGHTISRLLDDGYRVRATLRSLSREPEVRATLKVPDDAPLEFAAADLTEDAGWPGALAGCDYVMHMASPFPQDRPDDENELIVPAVDGTRRVLRAAYDAGVRRVVMTSSFAAMEYAPKTSGAHYVETDWTDPDGRAPYVKSKTLAERAAWEFVAAHPDGPELTVINPVGIIGPVFSNDYASSISLIKALLDGSPPVLPKLNFPLVDVRDVVDLHMRALTHPDAAGQRFLAAAGTPLPMAQMAAILRRRLGDAAARVPTRQVPDWVLRAAATVLPPLREITVNLGPPKIVSTAKAAQILGWQPRSAEDTVVATGESLLAMASAGV